MPPEVDEWAQRASAAQLAQQLEKAAECWRKAAEVCDGLGRDNAAAGFRRKASIVEDRIRCERFSDEFKPREDAADHRCTTATAAVEFNESEGCMQAMNLTEWVEEVRAAGGECDVVLRMGMGVHPACLGVEADGLFASGASVQLDTRIGVIAATVPWDSIQATPVMLRWLAALKLLSDGDGSLSKALSKLRRDLETGT